jgi:Zn-dependent protease
MNIFSIAISLFVILFAITIHEAAHGWAANRLGDPTAKMLGRVTLNPIPHIDPIGTVLLPAMLVIMGAPPFGWAKPVPVNPLNLKDPKKDNLLISAAGPIANFTAAIIAIILLKILKMAVPSVNYFLYTYLSGGGTPHGIQPLDGLALILFYAVFLNVFLAVFNLIPIPPLDGSGILIGLISEEAAQKVETLRPFGFIIVLGLLYLGVFRLIIRPIEYAIMLFLF